MEIKTVEILMGDVCTARCAVCMGSCSPRGTNIISEALLLKIIGKAARCKAEKISFSGGEPFLHPALLEKGLACAKEANLKTEVQTNGFWGAWDEKERDEKITPLPIDEFIISTDSYHTEFIPESHIRNAAFFLKKNKRKFSFKIGETKTSDPVNIVFKKMGAYKYMVNLVFYPFERAGRAAGLPEADFYPPAKINPMAKGRITVRYDGAVSAAAGYILPAQWKEGIL